MKKLDGEPLSRAFYSRSPIRVAKDLIGKTLVRSSPKEGNLRGIIVETEAYGESCDPASHAFRGRTKRNLVMFGEPGHAYIYFTYGMHYCLNFVTGRFWREKAGAVLIRAIKPTNGLEIMQRKRGKLDLERLADGPGKLCSALSIDLALNGIDVTRKEELYVLPGRSRGTIASPRIGIAQGIEKKWRFCAE